MVSALAKLTFYENLFIGSLGTKQVSFVHITGVSINQVEFWINVRALYKDTANCL